MPLETVYDIQQGGCRYGFVPAIFALLAVCSAIAWYRRSHWVRAEGVTQPSFSPKIGCAFFGMLAALGFITTWGDYLHLIRMIETDKVDVIEGVISNFYPAATIKSAESFEVAGHAFSYSKYAVKQGFNTLSLEGSPVANGKVARVYYVEGHIVKLEIAR